MKENYCIKNHDKRMTITVAGTYNLCLLLLIVVRPLQIKLKMVQSKIMVNKKAIPRIVILDTRNISSMLSSE